MLGKNAHKEPTMNPQRANKLYPQIGDLDGRTVQRWDPATLCSEHCCIYDDCPYTKKGRCNLEQNYMNVIFNNLIHPNPDKGIADQLNDIELQRVGIHLIPLYHQLIKMKKEAYSVRDISHVNKQGSIKIHPIFAEIREIIRCISKEINDLNINGKWERKFGKGGGVMDLGSGIGVEELLQHGDPDFTASLSGK